MNPGTDQRVVQKTPYESKIEQYKYTVDRITLRSFVSINDEAAVWRTRVGMVNLGDVARRRDIIERYAPSIVILVHLAYI